MTDGQLRLTPGARIEIKSAETVVNTDLFIRRPVLTTLLMSAIVIFGLMAYRLLPVSDLPNVDFPTIQVSASVPGASPETMASAVATPLERQFTTIAGIDSMTSTSALGFTQITIQFDARRATSTPPRRTCRRRSPRRARLLPPDMPTPPTYQKVNPADQPVIYLALSSPTLPLYTVDEYAQTNLAQRISTISGVAQVHVFGSQKYAVRVQVDPRALAARGIGIDEVEQAIVRGNVNKPTGTLYGPQQAVNVQATGQLMDAAAYRPLIVAYRNGVAGASRGDRPRHRQRRERQGRELVQRRARDRARGAAPAGHQHDRGGRRGPRAAADASAQQLPASVNLNVVYDRSVTIRESVHEVQFTLLLTIALVVMVIFLFLRNVSATIIPSLALPLSIIGTFAVMYLFGYRLDIISLMALTLCVGFVVDDAIVMLENIVRHMETGESRHGGRAARRARDRLHHPVDDDVARRGVHPGAVHGRHRRPAAPRVRRHDRRRDSDLGPRVADADADAVQPLPAPAARTGGGSRLYRPPSGSSTACWRVYDRSLSWTLRHRAHDHGGARRHLRR